MVVVLAPALDDDLRLEQRSEELAVEQLAQPRVKPFTVAVFPRVARHDVQSLHPQVLEPLAHRGGGELGAAGPKRMCSGQPMFHEQSGQLLERGCAAPPRARHDRVYSSITTRNRSLRTIMSVQVHEFVDPYVNAVCWPPQPDARPVAQAQLAAVWVASAGA